MKRIAVFFGVLALAACIRAGGNDFFPERNTWVESFQTLPITFYDNSMRVVKTELLTERNFPERQVLTAAVGYSVVDDKTYRKVYYAREVLRANENGGLTSISEPVSYKKNQQIDMIGEVMIDGARYALIPADTNGFVVLVRGDGKPYRYMGQIRHGRLALLNTEFIVYPDNFSFEPVMLSKSEQTTPVKGFDIKYGGLKGRYVTFIYYRYDAPSNDGLHDSGEFEVLSYPAKNSVIDIKGVGIKIVEARKDSIDYMILEK